MSSEIKKKWWVNKIPHFPTQAKFGKDAPNKDAPTIGMGFA